MAKIFIRVDVELSDELLGAFPQLTVQHHRASTTLAGELVDQQQLQGVLGLLDALQIPIAEVITLHQD